MYQRSMGLPRSKPKVRLTGRGRHAGSPASRAGRRFSHRTPAPYAACADRRSRVGSATRSLLTVTLNVPLAAR